jgi:flagellar biosynthetic protein FlhB
MSVRELKEEFKQTEGDPMIRQDPQPRRADAKAHDRGGAEGPVVITKPTHYAIVEMSA